MIATGIKRTILRLSTRNELSQYIDETTHGGVRFKDVGVSPDGSSTPASVSSVLTDGQSVRKISVDRDYDGNLYITLEE